MIAVWKVLQHRVRVRGSSSEYGPLLSLGEVLFCRRPPLAGPLCRPTASLTSVGLGEECAGMRSGTDYRKSTQQLAQYGQS